MNNHALHVDDEILAPPQMGHSLPGMALPPHQQASGLSDKQRSDMLAIPAKKSKGFDEAAAYQLDYQHYQSLMYAHCAQQQRVGSMSAFRPWAPKSFLHSPATYNAVAAFSTLPYLSQEPPVLQNPERVVRSTDRERFERTYQPNVALVPRKCVLAKEREKEQRERDRERIEREREREQERKLEHSREREKQELEEQERERKEREMQEHRRQQMLQQQNIHQKQPSSAQTVQEQMSLSSLCPTELKIKQERANTPTDIPQSPPLTNMSGDDEDAPRDHNGSAIPMVSPIAVAMGQQQRKLLNNNNGSNNSSCHSEGLTIQQQQLQEQQSRRLALYNSNSFACSSSSTTPTTPPQQQLLHAHLPPPKQYQQEQRHGHQLSQQQQQQQQQQLIHLRQSPRTFPPSPTETHSSEEFSGSNEITSSTSPAPCNKTKTTSRDPGLRDAHTQESSRDQQCQPLIATVNQHAKLLPTPITASFTANSNSNNHNELPSRIRISKNLINRSNIIRSPTPPPSLPPSSALAQLHPLQEQQHLQPQQQLQQHQPQLQVLQNHHQQYEFYKQNQRLFDQQFQQQQQQQQQPLSSMQHKQFVMHSHHQSHQAKHSPSQSSTVTGLNLSTHATKGITQLMTRDAQKQQGGQQTRPYNGIPYIGTEFELSTDTDDDSVNGEADSSHIASAWDTAIEALRDTRPKERERVLDLLRKVLHENQDMRYSNLQLSEMVQKRDAVIRELREQLQTCRRHLQMLSLRQELPAQTNGLDISDGFKDEESRGLLLKRSLSNTKCADSEHNSVAKDVGADDEHRYNSSTPMASPAELTGEKKDKLSTNDQLSDSEDGRDLSCNSKESEYDSDNGSDKESEHAADSINVNNDLRSSDDLPLENVNDLKDVDISEQPQAKRSRLESGSESNCSSNEEYSTVKHTTNQSDEQASRISKQDDDNSYGSEDDETPTANTISEFAEYSNTKNDRYTQITNTDDHGDDEEEEEATRSSAANGSDSNTNASEDEDNDSGRPLTHPLEAETDVQAPHSSSLSTVPTATTPLSPHSAATAGQLFDSSNSSDESSMKKAQMSASNALAKITEITETADDGDDGNVEANQIKELWRTKGKTQCKVEEVEKQNRDRSGGKSEISSLGGNAKASRFNINKEQYSSRSGRYPTNSNTLSTNTHENQQTGEFNENKFDLSVKVNNNDVLGKEPLAPRAPLPTKASKKQTPTPNTEVRIKKEII
ncbi:unnamed protein product [Ceratitis capitata]|uniref:(Mediterranean fruit fly) hypothetical protein n=1 Tax=Ceratitis capitata TaxID=7213 RepID=A0A811UI03_CERCA|nr:unnamed protein product [Ceratitis capitata]